MCAQVTCNSTFSTIGTPDATFVAQKNGNVFEFRGLTVNSGLSATGQDTITINNDIPVVADPDGVVGFFQPINYSLIPAANRADEIPFIVDNTAFNTGIFTGTDLTITNPGKYLVIYETTFFALTGNPQVTYRIRDASNLYTQFYSRSLGNDEVTSAYGQILDLPVGNYSFTIQITNLLTNDYNNLVIVSSYFALKKV